MTAQSNTDNNAREEQQVNTILVIDDDDNWCYITKRMIEKAGIGTQVITANNGQKALDTLQALKAEAEKLPEIIFLDLKMPVMDGFEFLDKITNLPELNLSNTQIFICTSSFLLKDKERASKYPIAGFITKPFTTEVLKSILI